MKKHYISTSKCGAIHPSAGPNIQHLVWLKIEKWKETLKDITYSQQRNIQAVNAELVFLK